MFLIRQNTKVELEDGTQLPIGEVKLGHRLRGQSGVNEVIAVTHRACQDELWELHPDLIGISREQPVMTTEGWGCVNTGAGQLAHPYLAGKLVPFVQESALVTTAGVVLLEYLSSVPDIEGLASVELELTGDHTFYVNGFLCHNKGGGGNTTTVTKTDPPKYLQPFLTDIAEQAQAAYQKVPQDGFSGQLVASPTDAQLQAIGQQKDIAAGLGGFGANTTAIANQQANKVLSGGYTAPANNVYQGTNVGTTDAVNAYLDPVKQQLNEDILPSLRSSAVDSGAYGGSRYYTEAAKQVNDNFTRQANNIAAQIGYGEGVRKDEQGFENFSLNQSLIPELLKIEQAASLTTPELATAGVNQDLLGSQILGQAGQAEQLFNQDVLDEAYQQYVLSTQTPFAGLDQYASIVGGVPAGGTSTTTGTIARPSGGSNFLSGALGGGLGAYGLASAIPALGFLGGPLGIGAGAILGGLLGL